MERPRRLGWVGGGKCFLLNYVINRIPGQIFFVRRALVLNSRMSLAKEEDVLDLCACSDPPAIS
jgi:hypothetical protein